MAAIENLEIIVDVDISSAIAKLNELQEELQNVGEAISAVDARGTEGIDIDTAIHDVDREIATAMAKIQAAEAMMSFDVPMNITPALPSGRTSPAGALPSPEIAGALPAPGGGGIQRGFPRLRRGIRRVSSSFAGLQRRLDEFDVRMSDMHNLLAALVPLLVVFIGTVPALVTAFVGLAAAAVAAAASLAALAGFGALGVGLAGGEFDMQRLTDMWEQIREDFLDAFAPLAEQLEPLFRDAVDGLGEFFQAIANQGDALMQLTDEARAFGQFVMDFVPGALRTLAATVEALAPQLANVGQAIQDGFNPFMRELTRLTAAALPAVSDFVQTIVAALPTIVEIGIEFTRVATAVLRFIGVLWDVITLGGALDGVMGTLIATILVGVTAVALLNKTLVQLALGGIWSAITALYRFMTATALASTQTTIFGTTAITSALSSLISFTAGLFTSMGALVGFSLTAYQAAIAAAAFWTAVTLGAAAFLIPMITGMAAGFLGLSDNIDQATSSLKEFDRVSGRTEGGFNPYGGNPPSSGAGAADGGGGNQTVINVESSGDAQDDRSNARYVSFRQGRTTGGNN